MNEWEELPGIVTARDMYQLLAQKYVLEFVRLDKVDYRMREYEFPLIPRPVEEQDEYQVRDYMDLDYFYMRNDVHMERLTEEQITVMQTVTEHPTQENVLNAMKVVQDTYQKVLAFSEDPDMEIELFPSVFGEGIVPGNALVFMIATMPDYDELGNIRDWEKERRRENLLFSLKVQLEPICEKKLGIPVRFLVI